MYRIKLIEILEAIMYLQALEQKGLGRIELLQEYRAELSRRSEVLALIY